MDYGELVKIIEQKTTKSSLRISNVIFQINQIKVFQTNNPVTKPTMRGGVYFADKNELKVEVIILDTSIIKHLSKAMLGPNKTFLDIFIEVETNIDEKISLLTNLTNSIQKSSKVVLYLTIKDIIKN